ncbi:MAG TPA: hypothetical protein VFH48_46225 [Chloroflexota bacterium]|nr:hypothetical protein [Chloroflexota bacterium]
MLAEITRRLLDESLPAAKWGHVDAEVVSAPEAASLSTNIGNCVRRSDALAIGNFRKGSDNYCFYSLSARGIVEARDDMKDTPSFQLVDVTLFR